MEVMTTNEQELTAFDALLYDELVKKVNQIGRKWVALAIGYHEQSVTDFVSNRNRSKRLTMSILGNLTNALKLREEYEIQEISRLRDELNDTIQRIEQARVEMSLLS
jgi:hypothetical protein